MSRSTKCSHGRIDGGLGEGAGEAALDAEAGEGVGGGAELFQGDEGGGGMAGGKVGSGEPEVLD